MSKTRRLLTPTALTFLLLVFAFCLCACAPHNAPTTNDTEQDVENTEDTGTIAAAWSPDSDCSVCHSNESAEGIACLSKGNASCTTCHTSETELAKVHEEAGSDKSVPKKLRNTSIEDATCLSCHYETTDGLVENTASIPPLVDDNGNEVNSHAVLAADHHADADLHCSSCHNPHSDKDAAKQAQKVCLSCHHSNVFECHTCHE